MKTRVRLRLILPVIAVAIAGLLFFQFGRDAVGLGSDEPKQAAASPAPASAEPQAPAAPEPQAAEPTTAPEPADAAPASEDPASEGTSESGGMTELRSALQTYGVVVLVVYSPQGNVDSSIVSEARLGADETGAGFVTVNATKETMVGELALTYDVRETPSVLVFIQGTEPELQTRFIGYADRQTVAQAVQDAEA